MVSIFLLEVVKKWFLDCCCVLMVEVYDVGELMWIVVVMVFGWFIGLLSIRGVVFVV